MVKLPFSPAYDAERAPELVQILGHSLDKDKVGLCQEHELAVHVHGASAQKHRSCHT